MPRTAAFSIVGLLLAAPAFVLMAASKSPTPIPVSLFVANYLFVATPHIIIATLALRFVLVRKQMLLSLALLNIALIGFVLWIHFAVSGRESSLAWILYIPLSAAVLVFVAVAATIKHRRAGSIAPVP